MKLLTVQKFFLLCSVVVLLVSCKNSVYEKFHEVPEKSWDKGYVMEYLIDLEPQKSYQLTVAFSYLAFIAHSNIQYNVKVTSPSQKVLLDQVFTTQFKDAQGNQLGDVMGDYGDISEVIEQTFEAPEAGNYKVEITQNTEAQSMGGITRVGLIVNKAKSSKE